MIPYGQAYRLRFIDFLLAKYGTLNRATICEYFELSMPQASLDIRTYLELAPDNADYDKSARTYRRTEKFKRAFP